MGCTSSSLKGTSPNTSALNTPAAALHPTLSTTSDPKSFTTSYSHKITSNPTSQQPNQPQPTEKAKPKTRRFSKRTHNDPSDEEMLRYTGMTNAEMKAWAAQQDPKDKRAYQEEVASRARARAGFDPLVAGAAMGGFG